jgi:hypothetical protein
MLKILFTLQTEWKHFSNFSWIQNRGLEALPVDTRSGQEIFP